MKLSSKLLLVMTPLIIAPLLVLGSVSLFKLQESATENSLGKVAVEVDHISDHLIGDINTARVSTELLSKSVSLQAFLNANSHNSNNAVSRKKLYDEIQVFKSIYRQYDKIKVLSVDGSEMIVVEAEKNRDVENTTSWSDIYKPGRHSDGKFSDVYLRPDNNRYAISFIKPLLSDGKITKPKERLLGYLSVSMDLSHFKQHVGGKHIEIGGDIIFVNKAGELAFESNDMYKIEHIVRVLSEGVNITEAKSNDRKEWWDENTLYNVRKINENLYLIATLPADVIYKSGKELGRLIFFTLFVSVMLAGSLMVLALRRYVLYPVSRLSKASKAIAEGHDVASLTCLYQDELGDLASSFNSMNEKIAQSKEELVNARLRAENLTHVKTSFIENISHEIRTPLTSIIGFSESLLDGDQDMSARVDSIKTIVRSGKHLLDIINGILDISMIDSDRLDVEIDTVKVFDIINEVKPVAEMQAVDKNIEFSIQYRFPIPEDIKTDALRVRQILINLLSNAVKFTDKGKVKMTVSYEKNNNKLCFEIADTGIGMKYSELKSVFDAFEKVDVSTTRRHSGIGLGLYLSRKLAQQLKGDIAVESIEGVGSQFSLILQCEVNERLLYEAPIVEPEEIKTVAKSVNDKVQYTGKVLVAEDIEDNQNLIRLYLTRFGLDCDIVENGSEALIAIKKNKYDLVLMDMQMPIMGGLDAVKNLRKFNKDLPVIALTASAMANDVKGYVTAGCNDFIAKPIDREIFSNVIGRYLSVCEPARAGIEPMFSSLLEEDKDARSLVMIFVKKLPELLEEIGRVYAEREWDALSERMHNLKGTGGNFGFLEITEVAQKIEFLIKKEGYDEIHEQLDLLDEMRASIEQGVELFADN